MPKIFVVVQHDLEDRRPAHSTTVMGGYGTLAAAEQAVKEAKRNDIVAHWETWDETVQKYTLNEDLKKDWLGELPEPTDLDTFALLWDEGGFTEAWWYEIQEIELHLEELGAKS